MQGRFHPYEGYTTATVMKTISGIELVRLFLLNLVCISCTSYAYAWSTYVNCNMVGISDQFSEVSFVILVPRVE